MRGRTRKAGRSRLIGQSVQALVVEQGLQVVQALAQRGDPVEALLQQGAQGVGDGLGLPGVGDAADVGDVDVLPVQDEGGGALGAGAHRSPAVRGGAGSGTRCRGSAKSSRPVRGRGWSATTRRACSVTSRRW